MKQRKLNFRYNIGDAKEGYAVLISRGKGISVGCRQGRLIHNAIAGTLDDRCRFDSAIFSDHHLDSDASFDAAAKQTTSNSPKTGDSTNMTTWHMF